MPEACGCGRSHVSHLHVNARSSRRDPTQTTMVRRAFERELTRRFRELKRLIREAIVERDVLGLQETTLQLRVSALAPPPRAFAFSRSGEKVAAFMDWLRGAQSDLIFSIRTGTTVRSASQASWANLYIDSAYQRGLASAAAQMRGAGGRVAPSWLDSAFFRPVHADRLGLIYTRVFQDLEGITQAMDRQISAVLARGIGEGRGVMDIARDLAGRVEKIGITRARVLARTEVIAAHADATLGAYREAQLEGVTVMAEFATAGDDSVCPECEALEGREMTIDQAEGLIPLHPNCRCAFLPVVRDPMGIDLA